MQKRFWIAIIFVFALLISACTAAATPNRSSADLSQSNTSKGIAPQPPSTGALEAPLPAQPPGGSGAIADSTANTSAAADRLVINNADLKIVVKDPAATMDFITSLAGKMNGWVVSSNLYNTTDNIGVEVPQATITIRVDAKQLNNAIAQIKSQVTDLKKDVQSETITGQDVTKEYTDLNSRLTNLQKAEAQLQEIMASASKTEDVLAVYNQLTSIREQIEVIQGQINYYKESASYSAISVTLIAQASIQPLSIGGWQPVGVARDAIQALISALQFLGSAAIWLILFLVPILIVIYIPLRLLWILFRRLRKPKAKAQPPAMPIPPTQQPPVQS